MKWKINVIASIGFICGAVFGIAGSIFEDSVMQMCSYEISSVGLIAASALLTIKFLNEKKEILSAVFLLLAIAEAVMSGGTALGQTGAQASFGAGMALYVPAFLLISITKGFPLWSRITGVLATIPFLIAASKIFMGELVLSTSALPGAGYCLLTITAIGWIINLLREHKKMSFQTNN